MISCRLVVGAKKRFGSDQVGYGFGFLLHRAVLEWSMWNFPHLNSAVS